MFKIGKMEDNNRHEKTIKALENFIDSYSMEGTCGAFVVPNPMGQDGFLIHLYLNENWIRKQEVRPHLVGKKLRDTLQKACKDYTGIDVRVTSSTTKCDGLDKLLNKLSESMSPHVKRRISDSKLLDELTTILDYEINLSYYDSASDAVEEVVNSLNERILDEMWETTKLKVSLLEKDELYWYLYHKFSKYIAKKYREEMKVNESKKKYVVTESQYNLILESQKRIDVFQKLIDSRMDYIRRVCDKGADDYEGDVGDESCRQIEQIEKVKVTEADWITIKHSNRPQEEKYMSVRIMVYYSSIRRGDYDADDLTYDLERMIRKSTGMPFILNYESTNTNTFFEW